MKKAKEVQFVAALDGIDLSKDQVENITKGIREVVMKELARIDTKGDLIIDKKVRDNPYFLDFPILEGIIAADLERAVARKIGSLKRIRG